MELELELQEWMNTDNMITYIVKRKGLRVGLLSLYEPYTEDTQKRTLMTINDAGKKE